MTAKRPDGRPARPLSFDERTLVDAGMRLPLIERGIKCPAADAVFFPSNAAAAHKRDLIPGP
jgi:hypothetical protein